MVATVVSGVTGIGVAMVLTPVFLKFNMNPQVMTATT
jgi:hypothetical protein